MQAIRFLNGGFVLHRIPINGQTYSAWYHAEGGLVACERTTIRRASSVPMRHRLVRERLAQLGRRYAAVAAVAS